MRDWGARFEHLREVYRRDDGSKWTGAALERATGGEVSQYFVSDLRKSKIGDPGFSKIVAISRVMGIPLQAWIDDDFLEQQRGQPTES